MDDQYIPLTRQSDQLLHISNVYGDRDRITGKCQQNEYSFPPYILRNAVQIRNEAIVCQERQRPGLHPGNRQRTCIDRIAGVRNNRQITRIA
ncbi:hypothetical protein D3C73_1395660 [compost metagenome]